MGGPAQEDREEGVMAKDFFWSYTDEPHASRCRQILAQHPKIRELFGPYTFAFLKITMVVLLQLWTATVLRDTSFTKLLLVAYFFGSTLNHNLFLAIHELSDESNSRLIYLSVYKQFWSIPGANLMFIDPYSYVSG